MIFGCLRHGETAWNRDKRIQGQGEHPLTELGQEQARAWGRALVGQGWRRILSSDLGRAQETAALLNEALGLPLLADPRLREQDWGDWTGRTVKELEALDPQAVADQEAAGWDFRPPGGESRREVLDRALAALDDAARGRTGPAPHTPAASGPALVITHRGVLKCLAYDCLGWTFLPHEPDPLKPRRLHRFRWTGPDAPGGRGALGILSLNEKLEPAS